MKKKQHKQPISLKFNGEKLQIIEAGKVLKEYEARSGQMENRNAESNNIDVLNQPDNETSNDNQTQPNILNSANSMKPVYYPASSAASPKGYETVVGGKLLEDYGKNFSQHLNIVIRLSSTLKSTAAGAYQFLWSTWRDYAIKNGINDFSPINQDRVCVILLRYKRYALDDIMQGNIKHAIELCNKEWASLPGSPYGQRTEALETCLENYKIYFEEEINGKTSLAVPIGDLDDLLFK